MSTVQKSAQVKHRSKGAKTKHQILNAAIEVLASYGIKGTTHRAIAKQADIQLSLTTYYFKDIQELIHEAFKLNSEQTLQRAALAWESAFEILKTIGKTNLKKVSVKVELCDSFSEMAARFLLQKIKEQQTSLAVEQLLYTEIQITPELRELAKQHRIILIGPFLRLCQYFNKIDPEIDADILLTMFMQLEYRHLALSPDEAKFEDLYTMIRKMLAWIMKLKSKNLVTS